MPLLLDWANLWSVALPFFICISVAAIFTVFLWRAAWKSGLPHRREPCATCYFEDKLIRQGTCRESCAVNVLPTLPLLLFLFTCSFALFFIFFPSLVLQYLLPGTGSSPGSVNPQLLDASIALVAGANGGAAVLLAGYFVQDKAWHREFFFRISAAGTISGIVLGLVVPGPIGTYAIDATPFALGAVLLGAGLEHRAIAGRPVLGMKALGASTVPLFLVAVVVMFRIFFVLSAAYPSP